MANDRIKQSKPPLVYQIKLKGHLPDDWSDWFGGLNVSRDEAGNTLLIGDVVDQARLHGLLKRIRDAGIELISLNPVTEEHDDITSNIEQRKQMQNQEINMMTTMKMVIQTQYGTPDVLQLVEVEKPAPADNEVLVKIHATTVTATEAVFRQGKPYFSRLFTGLTKPKIKTLGEELAGEIVAIGKDVTNFKVGDRVFGTAGPDFGANAGYLCVQADGVLAPMPHNVSYQEAAASVDGFLTALPFLRDVGLIKSGQKVLINGASGSVGSAAVQIARYYGAEVTGVCSARNIDLVKSLGADHVIDYTTEDFTRNGETYNIIFDAVGKITFSHSKDSLTPDGIFLESGMGLDIFRHVIWTSFVGSKKAKIAATGLRPPHERAKDLQLLKELMEENIIKPVIDRSYPLTQISEAHRYVDTGRKRGNVVINIVNN